MRLLRAHPKNSGRSLDLATIFVRPRDRESVSDQHGDLVIACTSRNERGKGIEQLQRLRGSPAGKSADETEG